MSILIEQLEIPDVALISTDRHGDNRGFFSETYNKKEFERAGLYIDFVQDNHTKSLRKGTLRGLHFQIEPFAQAKLVRVAHGSIFDVAVDLRVGSVTYGRHISAIISAENWNQILIPVGFAHGLITLEPNTEVLYKVSSVYSADHDKGLLWNDPALGIQWPVSAAEVILSEKDKRQPKLEDLPAYFRFEQEG